MKLKLIPKFLFVLTYESFLFFNYVLNLSLKFLHFKDKYVFTSQRLTPG
jgi:hypothetical protein